MAEDIAVIGIEIQTSGADRAKKSLDDLTGSGKKAEVAVSGLQGASERAQKSLGALGVVAGGVAATMGVSELIRLTDQYTKYTAQLKLATTNTSDYASALSQVRAISTAAQQDISAVGTLFARISNGTRELGLSQQKMAGITETVALSLKVSGAAASESASAMLQLSQAFASGQLRGEEFNAVNEAAPRLMKALADGIGVPIGALREMASQGKITSEVMANALPRALNELREEAKSVQTIAGSFTVLKNNVLEFVGTQSQASGAVRVLTAGIDSLANNLNLIAAAAGGLAAAKLADTLIGVAAATARGVGSTLAYAESLNAQRAAAIAAAQAEVGATAAMAARVEATQAAIVIAREEYATKLATANATISSSQAALQQAAAVIASSSASLQAARSAGALSFALATARESSIALTGAQAAQTAATEALAVAERQRVAALAELAILGQQQARVSAQVTAATTAQAAAQAALSTATSAGGAAAGVAMRALGFLGGPIGVITTLLGLGATAWMLWGDSSKKAQTTAADVVESTTAEIIANLDKQNAKLRERIELGKQLGLVLGQEPTDGEKRQASIGRQISDLQAGKGLNGGAPLPEAARIALLQTLLKQYGELEAKIGEGKALKGEDAQTKASNDLVEVRQRLLGVNKQYLEDLEKYQKALKAGSITEKAYIEEVSALAKKAYDSSTAGKAAKAGEGALNDSLSAQLQAYKNNDKAILDSRKAFYDAQALLVKLGGKSELDAIDESLAKEEEVWAQRKANFEAELAQAAKKKTSQAEVARITGQMQDAERDYEQNIAKLRAESALADAKSLDALEARIAGQEKASRAAMEQVRMAELEGKAIGLTGDALRVFNQQQLESSIPLALKMQAAWADQAGALGDLGRAARDQIQAMRDLAKAQGENRAAQMVYEYAKGIEDSNKLLQAEIGLMGMSEQARTTALEQLRIQLDLEQKIAFVKANVADTDKQAADIAKLQASASIAKANAANKAFLDEWKQSVSTYDDIFRRGFADMLNNGKNGWKSFTRSLVTTFKTAVADQIYKMFAQKFVVNIVGNIVGMFGGGLAGTAAAAAGGGGAGGGASTALSAASLFGAGGLGGSLAAGAGWLTGATTLGGSLTAGASLIGTGTLAGFTSGLGVIAGALGPIALGIGALMAIAKATKGETRTGGQFGVSFDGTVTNQRRDQVYTYQGQQFDRDFSNGQRNALIAGQAYRLEGDPVQNEQAIRDAVSGTASGINAFLKALGSKATLTGFSAGLETSSKGRGGVFAGGILSDGTTFGESGKGDNYAGTLYEKFSTNSPDFKTALENFTLDLKQSTIQALQSVTDIPQTVQKMLEGVDAEGLSEESANALLESINAQIVGVQNLTSAFEAMGLDELAQMGFDAAAGLAAAAGGFDKLQTNLNTYYDNFYTDEEKRANLQKQVDKQFAELGIDVPKNRDEFRRLVEGTLEQVDVQDKARASLSKQINDAIAGAGKDGFTLADAAGRSLVSTINPALLGNGPADPALAGKLNGFLAGVSDLAAKGLDPEAFDKGLAGLIDVNAEVLGIGKDASKTAATLLALSGTFAQLNESADDAAARIAKEQADARDKALRGLERAIDAEKKALQSQIDVAQDVASTMSGLFDLLKSNVQELYGEVDSTRAMLAVQGNDFITQALATARTTGYLPDQTQLADAISAARGGLDSAGYASQFELDRDRLVLAGKLSELEGLTGKQLTSAERTVKELEAQSDQLDKTLDYWKEQIDIANGTYEATLSVTEAIKDLEALMFPKKGDVATNKPGMSSGGGSWGPTWGGASNTSTKYQTPVGGYTGGTIYAGVSLDQEKRLDKYAAGYHAFDGTGDAAGLNKWIADNKLTPEDLAGLSGLYESDWERWYKANNIPAFAVGTNYVPRDMLAQIHEGEAIVPKAYNPAANPGMGGGNDELVAEVRALREAVAALQAAASETAGNTRPLPQLGRQFDTYSNGGQFSRQKAMA